MRKNDEIAQIHAWKRYDEFNNLVACERNDPSATVFDVRYIGAPFASTTTLRFDSLHMAEQVKFALVRTHYAGYKDAQADLKAWTEGNMFPF